MSEKKVPKINTIRKWKAMFPWLDFLDGMKMVCKSCKSQEEKLRLMPGANLTFVTGSTNYRPSTLKDHAQTDGHKRAVGEEAHAEAEASGVSLQPRKVYQAVPSSSSIVQGLNRMGDNERESVTKLNHIAFHVATKGLPFKYSKDKIELQKLHDVKFHAWAYENESACRDFILNISNFLFDKLVRENLSRVNFFIV